MNSRSYEVRHGNTWLKYGTSHQSLRDHRTGIKLTNGLTNWWLIVWIVFVIVMTFWYVFGTDLTFSNFLNFYSSLGNWSRPPMFSMFTWFMFIQFSYVSFFTRLRGQEKSLSYYDLFDFGVLLIYGRIPTLVFFHFLHNPTTPILPIDVDQRRSHLQEDTTRPRSMVIRKIPTVPRRTFVAPD